MMSPNEISENRSPSRSPTIRMMANEAARGGWITLPYMIATMAGLTLSSGWSVNLITFLKDQFNFQATDAAKINNYVNGSIYLIPMIAAIISDSSVGSFLVICVSSLISFLGVVLLALIASISQLRPPSCTNGGSTVCRDPSPSQSALLYFGLILSSVGAGGTRFSLASMGADQLDSEKQRGVFFSWYIFTMYLANFLSATLLVYVEENVSWAWGFSIFTTANVLGSIVFMIGRRFYRLGAPRTSPFRSIARVVIASIRKRKIALSPEADDYYHHEEGSQAVPTPFFRFLNVAALKSSRQESRICTVEEVEQFKSIIKIVPMWLNGLILSIPITIQMSFVIIQGKAMDNHLTSQFKIPAASIQVCALVSTCLAISVLDRLVFPLWTRLAPRRPPTPLQRVGIGHVITVMSMAVSAIVEAKRRSSRHPMSLLWLAPQQFIVGVSEAFHFTGLVEFCYQEFPDSFKSTSTAVVGMTIGGAFYASNLVIDVVQKTTGWLPNNINQGKLDNVFWLCTILGVLNFLYFLVCSYYYKYQKT